MHASSHPQRARAVFMLLLASLYWGLSFPLIKAIELLHERLLPGGGNWFITACALAPRFLLATLILTIWGGWRVWQMTIREFKQGAGLGLFSAMGLVFQVDGLQFTSASTSAFITQFYVIMIPVWLVLRTRRAPPFVVWVCSGLVIAGVAVLARLNLHEVRLGRGELETLFSSLFFMGQIFWLERPEFADNRPGKITLSMFAVEAFLFSAMVWGTAPQVRDVFVLMRNPLWVGFNVALTLSCTVGAFTLMNKWQPKITATEAGLIYCSEPVFAAVMALFLPALFSRWAGLDYANETLSANLLIGGSLITSANVLIQLKPPVSPTPKILHEA